MFVCIAIYLPPPLFSVPIPSAARCPLPTKYSFSTQVACSLLTFGPYRPLFSSLFVFFFLGERRGMAIENYCRKRKGGKKKKKKKKKEHAFWLHSSCIAHAFDNKEKNWSYEPTKLGCAALSLSLSLFAPFSPVPFFLLLRFLFPCCTSIIRRWDYHSL